MRDSQAQPLPPAPRRHAWLLLAKQLTRRFATVRRRLAD
jgi:hypothetical protein